MNNRKSPLLFGPFILILAILACTMNIGGPASPDQHIPVSTEAAGDLQSAIQTAVAAGEVSAQETLVITEPQLTSYLAARLMTQAQPIFSDPQVYLRDGQIQIYGTAQQGYFQANIKIVLTAGVDEQGYPKIELATADFGPLPVPTGFKEALTASIQEAYTGAIGPIFTGFRLVSITVSDGTMTIVGRTK
jgi:hypothetical protein